MKREWSEEKRWLEIKNILMKGFFDVYKNKCNPMDVIDKVEEIYKSAIFYYQEKEKNNVLKQVHEIINEAYLKQFPFENLTNEPLLNMQIEINNKIKCKCGCHDANSNGICPIHCCKKGIKK